MFDTDLTGAPYLLDALGAERVLELASESVPQRRRAELRPMRLTARWAQLHPASPGDGARWSQITGEWRYNDTDDTDDGDDGAAGEAVVPSADRVGGPGCPELSASSITELGTAMGLSRVSAAHLVQDTLDLVFRLPGIWERCNALEVDLWKARLAARLTHGLSAEAAAFVDADLARRIGKIGGRTIEMVVALAIARFHPEKLAEKAAGGQGGVARECAPSRDGGLRGDLDSGCLGGLVGPGGPGGGAVPGCCGARGGW